MNPFALIALALVASPSGDGAETGAPAARSASWHFVLPAAGEPFESAPYRALTMSREKPEDLIERVAYRGVPARRRYAQIRFGSPSSIRVTVVLDEVGPGDADLYVDADRNRRIDVRDLVSRLPAVDSSTAREQTWRVPVCVAMVEKDTTRLIPRALVFRLGASGRTLAFAAAGYLEGKVEIRDRREAKDNRRDATPVRSLAVRRVDGDGNGLLTDAQDRLWIDLNADGRFDPVSEQFLYGTVLNLAGKRVIVRSDEVGSRLAIEPLVGVGTLKLAVPRHTALAGASPGALEIRATILGRDGSVFSLSAAEPATVPVGEYRLGAVVVCLKGTERGDEPWNYIFSNSALRGEPKWYRVDKEATAAIDPIGVPSFELSLPSSAGTAKPGEDLSVQPLLYNGDGLLINAAFRGAPIAPSASESLGARVTLAATDGEALSVAHSGFS
jgi:hypothetical protein